MARRRSLQLVREHVAGLSIPCVEKCRFPRHSDSLWPRTGSSNVENAHSLGVRTGVMVGRYRARMERKLTCVSHQEINRSGSTASGWDVNRTPHYANSPGICPGMREPRGIPPDFRGYGARLCARRTKQSENLPRGLRRASVRQSATYLRVRSTCAAAARSPASTGATGPPVQYAMQEAKLAEMAEVSSRPSAGLCTLTTSTPGFLQKARKPGKQAVRCMPQALGQ